MKSTSIRLKIISLVCATGIILGSLLAFYAPNQAKKVGSEILENDIKFIAKLLVENLALGMQSIYFDDGAALEQTLALLKSDSKNGTETISDVWIFDADLKNIKALNSVKSGTGWGKISNKLFVKDEGDKLKAISPMYDAENNLLGYVEIDFSKQFYLDRADQNTYYSLLIALLAISIIALSAFWIGGRITGPMNRMVEALASGAAEVGMASSQVYNSSQLLSDGASYQASSLEEASSALEEMAGMTRQNADNARQANSMANKAGQSVKKGSAAMEVMTNAMQGIYNSSYETAKIIKVIDEIAFQTNLLALNAAVEAARAGDAGKGFAVVAEEVRHLAQRSAEAARNTNELIEGSQGNADKGVKATQELTEIFNEINDTIIKVSDLIGEVSVANDEQSQGIEQVNASVAQVDEVTQKNVTVAVETSAASQQMAFQAQQMQQVVTELSNHITGKESPNERNTPEPGEFANYARNSQFDSSRQPAVNNKAIGIEEYEKAERG